MRAWAATPADRKGSALKSSVPSRPVPVAVIGLGCMFPQAEDEKRYWANIRDGRDAITEIPATHWRPEEYFDPDPRAPDRTYARRGGFLTPVDFPLMDFGLSPNAIEATDTTQLLGLLAARSALENAGYGGDRGFDRERVSVILGVTGALEMVVPLGARLGRPIWKRALADSGVPTDLAEQVCDRIAASYVGWQENSFPGLLGNVAAGRIANRLDLKGSNCVVDAACASSLAALHMAMLELASGRSDMAVCGGVDTFSDIFMYMCFSKTPALSPTGDARPFDAQADGTILGEGVGVVVLKRLDDARRDGDRIRAVIRSVGTSSDGKGQAVYAPSAAGQARALREAYTLAGALPETIELVEAHGTGTKVGDSVELAALESVYSAQAQASAWCALGSVKSQVGHTKAAAGVAGLIKAILALEHKVLPPSIKVKRPIDSLATGRSPFYLNTAPRPWLSSGRHPRRAAVSAFGFGGSNYHCVLEEAEAVAQTIDWDGDTQIVALSADRPETIAQELAQFEKPCEWQAFRAQAARSRRAFRAGDLHRMLFVASRGVDDPAALAARARSLLSTARAGASTERGSARIVIGEGRPAGKLAVLFPGQGSQYVGMLRELACRFPVMHQALERFHRRLPELADRIYPRRLFDDRDARAAEDALRDTRYAQPALGAIALGLWRVLERFGVRADLAGGHSFGELTAWLAAGRIDEERFADLAIRRGALAGACAAAGTGAMLAVLARLDIVSNLIREHNLDLVIANKNAPDQCVLSGSSAEILRARRVFESAGVVVHALGVSAAFHSPGVRAARDPFRQALAQVDVLPGSIPVYSNLTAGAYPHAADAARDLLADQLTAPVEFTAQVEAMHHAGARVFLEVGPDAKLTGLVRRILAGRDHVALAVDPARGKEGGLRGLATLLANLAGLGYDIALRGWDDGELERSVPARKPGLTVKVSGANAKPATSARAASPLAAASERPVKNPDRLEPATTTLVQQDGNARTMNPPSEPYHPLSQSVERNGEHLPTERKPVSLESLPVVAGDRLTAARESLAALERMAERTADLHRLFLEGQERTQQAFMKLLEEQDRLGLGGACVPPEPRAQSLPAPAQAELKRPAHPVEPHRNGNGHAEPARSRHTHTHLPEPSAPRVVGPAPRPATQPAQAPIATTAHKPTPAFESLLLDVVAEKTGYPIEALDLDQSLDADLGVDSIKRVEILSALQERVPGLPAFAPDQLGSLTTLRSILHLLSVHPAQRHEIPAHPDPKPEIPAQPEPAAAFDHAGRARAEAAIKQAIADKTGYPAEMLALEMTLDGDLGIDSIKRVEIFSALEETLPGARRPDAEAIASLTTLAAIVDFLAGGANASASALEAPQAPAAAAAIAAADSLAQVVLETVADKTGYPVDMLELDMALDADLGIDSIKRVEILSAVQERRPDCVVVDAEELASLATLRAIVERLGNRPPTTSEIPAPESTLEPAGTHPPAPSTIPNGKAEVAITPLSIQAPRSALLERIDDGQHPGAGSVFWLMADESPLSRVLGRQLESKGLRVDRIDPGACPSEPPALDGLVILAPEHPSHGFIEHAFEVLHASARTLKRTAETRGAFLASITRLGGSFGLKGVAESTQAETGALAGMIKTAALEWPGVNAKAMDVDPNLDAETAARRIIMELGHAGPIEIGIRGESRIGIELAPWAPAGDPRPQPLIRRGEVILVTGGARGVTAAAATALAERYKPTLVLLGRGALPAPESPATRDCRTEAELRKALLDSSAARLSPRELAESARAILAGRAMRANLERMQRAGATVIHEPVDVRDPHAVGRVIERIRREQGEPRGLVHGAGVLADRNITDQTLDQFRVVHGTKVRGLENVLAALDPRLLRFVALFSSSTARYGRVGQVAYAAANEALNKIGQALATQLPETRVVSFNWGPWDGGMVDASLAAVFQREGIGLIPLEAGARVLVDAIESAPGEPVELVVIAGEPPQTAAPAPGRSATVPSAGDAECIARRELSVASAPVLASHVIDGHAVLPMALILEWLAEAAVQRHPGLVLEGLDQLTLYKGVVLADAPAVTVETYLAKGRWESGKLHAPVEMRSTAAKGRVFTHARATVILGEAHGPALPRLQPIIAEQGRFDPDDYYREVLFHGPELRGLERIEGLDAQGATAWAMAAPAPARWLESPLRGLWLTDPLVVDCAFQLMTIWCRERLGNNSLPTALGAYRQYCARFPREGVRITARVSRSSESRAVAELEFSTGTGELVAAITGYECVVDASLKRAFRRNQLLGLGQGSAASSLSRVD